MSKLILMRHGQASFGSDRYDCLSELGCVQARATGRWMRGSAIQPSLLVHGPRQRQFETACMLKEQGGFYAPMQQQAELDEFAEGEEIFKAAELFWADQCGRWMVAPGSTYCGIMMSPARHGLWGKYKLRDVPRLMSFVGRFDSGSTI